MVSEDINLEVGNILSELYLNIFVTCQNFNDSWNNLGGDWKSDLALEKIEYLIGP